MMGASEVYLREPMSWQMGRGELDSRAHLLESTEHNGDEE